MALWKFRRPIVATPPSTERRGFIKRMLAFAPGGAVLLQGQMPSHGHPMNVSGANGISDTPANNILARNASGVPQYGAAPGNASLAPGAIGAMGGNQPHENRPPFLGLNYIIALEGIFPSRN